MSFNYIQPQAADSYGYNGSTTLSADVANNLLQINIYFTTLNIHTIQESITYEWNTIIYALGGAMSLYLGISLVMIFEVFEWLIDTMINLICKKNGK